MDLVANPGGLSPIEGEWAIVVLDNGGLMLDINAFARAVRWLYGLMYGYATCC